MSDNYKSSVRYGDPFHIPTPASKPPATTVTTCHKCKQPMTMTPVCTACGIIPIATGSFEQLQLEIDRLKADVAKLENQLARTPTRCNEEPRK